MSFAIMNKIRHIRPAGLLPAFLALLITAFLPLVRDVTAQEMPEAAREAAFSGALDANFPLTPDEIAAFLARLTENQKALSAPPGKEPEPLVHVETLSLDPGHAPPIIRVAAGYVTTLSFLDATGAPWPIRDIAYGGEFNIPQPEEGSNLVRITPLVRFGKGNMSIRLIDLKTVVTMRIEAAEDVVHYRFDARMPDFGPGAEQPLIDHTLDIAADDRNLMMILDGTPPDGAAKLEVNGLDGRSSAWRIENRLFLRTPFTLLSPGWRASVASGDGMRVYELEGAPVLLLSDQGAMQRARIQEVK